MWSGKWEPLVRRFNCCSSARYSVSSLSRKRNSWFLLWRNDIKKDSMLMPHEIQQPVSFISCSCSRSSPFMSLLRVERWRLRCATHSYSISSQMKLWKNTPNSMDKTWSSAMTPLWRPVGEPCRNSIVRSKTTYSVEVVFFKWAMRTRQTVSIATLKRWSKDFKTLFGIVVVVASESLPRCLGLIWFGPWQQSEPWPNQRLGDTWARHIAVKFASG